MMVPMAEPCQKGEIPIRLIGLLYPGHDDP